MAGHIGPSSSFQIVDNTCNQAVYSVRTSMTFAGGTTDIINLNARSCSSP